MQNDNGKSLPDSTGQAKRAAKQAGGELKNEMKGLAQEARQEAKSVAADARDQVEHAAEGVLDTIADQLESFAQELRGQDMESLLHRCKDTAHRSPELFFAGSVAAGLAMARFMKSSASTRRTEDSAERGRSMPHSSYQNRTRTQPTHMQPVNATAPLVTGIQPTGTAPRPTRTPEVK